MVFINKSPLDTLTQKVIAENKFIQKYVDDLG